jgi:hypothetical protein
MKRWLPYLLLILLLNLAGWSSFQASRRQGLLSRQLEQSVYVLAAENQQATSDAQYLIEGIKAVVAKNRNQPAYLAQQRQAEALHARVAALADSLQVQAELLRRRTGNALTSPNLRVLDSQPFRAVYKVPVARWLALRQQLAACAQALRQAVPGPALAPLATLPAPAEATTIVEALADLARAEYQLKAYENRVLQHIAQSLARKSWLAVPVALATAESNVVAPGSTYRAQLLVAAHFASNQRMRMTCDGRPIPVDSTGIGQVRFQAPLRPGPAAWTGTIRVSIAGRDTAFAVRVPYRVARR